MHVAARQIIKIFTYPRNFIFPKKLYSVLTRTFFVWEINDPYIDVLYTLTYLLENISVLSFWSFCVQRHRHTNGNLQWGTSPLKFVWFVEVRIMTQLAFQLDYYCTYYMCVCDDTKRFMRCDNDDDSFVFCLYVRGIPFGIIMI